MKKFIFSKVAGFSEHLFSKNTSVTTFKHIQGILLIILKLLQSLTKLSLLELGDEVWGK